MRETPLVACLTCTYGRFQRMRECLAFFLLQDYPAKHLFILNNHPVPLRCDLPGVTIFNQPSDEPGIPRNRLLKLASDHWPLATEFVHTWDDDDAWLPWHLSQAVRQMLAVAPAGADSDALTSCAVRGALLGTLQAWKPARSWIHFEGTGEYKLNSNNYEASMIVRRSYMQRVGYGTASGNEHRPLLDALKADQGLAATEVGARASYIYAWRGDFTHASAALARDMKAGVHEQTLGERDAAWRRLQTDPGDGKTPLTPTSVSGRYRDLLAHCRATPGGGQAGLSEYEALELEVMLRKWSVSSGQPLITDHCCSSTDH